MRAPTARIVAAVILISAISTAIHYTDNYLYISDYPQPDWIARETIYVAWTFSL